MSITSHGSGGGNSAKHFFSFGDFFFLFFEKETATFIKKIEYEASQNTKLPVGEGEYSIQITSSTTFLAYLANKCATRLALRLILFFFVFFLLNATSNIID